MPVQQPLALVLYEKLMPGSHLVNRLQDLKYRVTTISEVSLLVTKAEAEAPMLVLADLDFKGAGVGKAISHLRRNPSTAHIPVIAFADEGSESLIADGQQSGATLVVTDSAVLAHLPQLLEQALHLE